MYAGPRGWEGLRVGRAGTQGQVRFALGVVRAAEDGGGSSSAAAPPHVELGGGV
jgi:hypothetical protein